jgi:hypothetical protein
VDPPGTDHQDQTARIRVSRTPAPAEADHRALRTREIGFATQDACLNRLRRPRYPTIDVRKFVFRAHIINLFKSVHYDEAELQDFLATKK